MDEATGRGNLWVWRGGRRMITLTILEQVKKGSRLETKRYMKLYHSMDKARKEIDLIVKEMKLAKREKREPKIRIDGVSYDTKSERALLLELKAITSIDNEDDDNY
jgi:hypothetical protein